MVENGHSGGGKSSLPPNESHDEFQELCALSTTGLLTADERARLEAHLRGCPSCREVQAQYKSLVDAGIPAAAIGHIESSDLPDWQIDQAEAALFDRLNREQLDQGFAGHASTSTDASDARRWRQMWVQLAAGFLVAAALGFAIYRDFGRRESVAGNLVDHKAGLAHNAESAAMPPVIASPNHPADQVQLNAANAEIKRLQSEIASLQQNAKKEQDSRDLLAKNFNESNSHAEALQRDLDQARQRLDALTVQGAQNALAQSDLNRQIEELKTSLSTRDAEIAREHELLDHDRDIRELMGSRNLYIAEVYDVAKSGDTQRPFGRVFYTQGKSLIFYAYDLDQQPGLRDVSTFQAWGRRGPDQDHAVNLGILYADNAAKRRWVLKSEDPKMLSDIDAVFVTVEPHGGSSHPTGKPFLFAYLRILANHP
jgi:hypothetical protein